MVISPQTLHGAYVAFNTTFNKAFADAAPLYGRIATVVPSSTESETYAWLGDIPGMREWIGNREIQNLSGSEYTIKNKSFELTVGIPRKSIEDDKLGLYGPSIQMMAQAAALKPDELIFELLKAGFTKGCYDGKSFFADDHKVGKQIYSNKGTKKLTPESYAAARAAMMSLTNSKGRSLNIVPDLLVVPPSLDAEARKILLADQIDGTTNTMKGTAVPLVAPQLSGADTSWFLLATQRPIKPLIYQERQKVKFVAKTGETDDNVFLSDTYLYGADSRGNVGFGFWQMAYGSLGTVG